MQNILVNTTVGSRSATPWILLLILGGYVLASLFVFLLLAQLLILPFFNFDLNESMTVLGNPFGSDQAKMPLMVIQGVTSLGAFVLVPLFFIHFYLKLSFRPFFEAPKPTLQPVFMVLVIMFCFMVANSIVIEWNQQIRLPDALKWFEDQARSKELQAEALTRYLTTFGGLHEFLIAFVIIAILPAVGEELLFRGLVQNLLHSAFKNAHVAIWVAAFLFGLFHLQFYGVVPRTFLGVLFGYLYYWSGHLWVAMLGHFLNNGLTLVMLYLSQQNILNFDPLSSETSPPMYMILLFLTAGLALLYLFRNYFRLKEDG